MARTREEPSRQGRDALERVYGLRAGLAVFIRRRTDIVRIAYGRAVEREVSELTHWASSFKVPCMSMSEHELDRFAGSSHHEGLCIAARPRPWLSLQGLGDALVRTRGAGVALDRVRNPYNVGAVMRTAAFFGLQGALVGAPAPHPGLAPIAVRVAEGGVEALNLARTTDLAASLPRLRARGIHVFGADGKAKTSAIGFAFPRPAMLVVGNEREGLSSRIRAECDALLAIPGCGAVQSLNVAVATGLLIGEMVR